MDTLDSATQESSLFDNGELRQYIAESAKWGKFLAIVGYVGIGLLVLVSVFVMMGMSQFGQASGNRLPMGFLGFIYIIIAVFYFFPVNYLYQFSVQVRRGMSSNDSQTVISGFGNLKSMFKFLGIFTIVVLSIYAIILLGAIVLLINR